MYPCIFVIVQDVGNGIAFKFVPVVRPVSICIQLVCNGLNRTAGKIAFENPPYIHRLFFVDDKSLVFPVIAIQDPTAEIMPFYNAFPNATLAFSGKFPAEIFVHGFQQSFNQNALWTVCNAFSRR